MKYVCILAGFAIAVGCANGKKGEGQTCDDDSNCVGDLSCVDNRCEIGSDLNKQMTEQSGVVVQPERAVPGRTVPGSVKVRQASDKGFAFAVCGSDERLVGGWCSPGGTSGDTSSPVVQSVSGHTDEDTIGARWTCNHSALRVTAFALCQKLQTGSPTP